VSAPKPPKPTRGLSSINAARDTRLRNKGRMTPQFVLIVAGLGVCGLIAYRVVSDRELNTTKDKLYADQKAAQATLGAEWFPTRDRIEKTVLDAAKEYRGDLVDPEAVRSGFRSQPGVYLRLRVADAKDVAAIRKLAPSARRDAFAGCFLRESNERTARGEPDGGAFPEQPWNLAQAYAASRVLDDEWTKDIADAPDMLRLRLFEEQFDKALKVELPLAARIVKSAQFFLLALDEDVPQAATRSDGGAITEEALQLFPHPTRVHVIDLKSGREILRVRRTGKAMAISAGDRMVTDSEMKDAMQRQVNNCDLAQQVEATMTPPGAEADAGR
jgi:hypothetical protein